jgi:hypothetical protein
VVVVRAPVTDRPAISANAASDDRWAEDLTILVKPNWCTGIFLACISGPLPPEVLGIVGALCRRSGSGGEQNLVAMDAFGLNVT